MSLDLSPYSSLLEVPYNTEQYYNLKKYIQENPRWLESELIAKLPEIDSDELHQFSLLFIEEQSFYNIVISKGTEEQVLDVLEFATYSDNPFNDSIIKDVLSLTYIIVI